MCFGEVSSEEGRIAMHDREGQKRQMLGAQELG